MNILLNAICVIVVGGSMKVMFQHVIPPVSVGPSRFAVVHFRFLALHLFDFSRSASGSGDTVLGVGIGRDGCIEHDVVVS